MTSGEIYALKLRRENGILAWRSLMGPTNAEQARKDSPSCIRALYGKDVQENATHGSDSEASSARECNFYFPNEQTLALIKPDAVRAANNGAIVERIESAGFRVVEM